MNDNDQMNDSAVLRELRDSLSGVITPERPPLEAITARGRAHRRHRLTGIAGVSVAAAAGAALVLGLIGVPGPAPARSTGTIRTAAFTLVRNANGTDTLTIKVPVLFQPATLQADLAQSGIPAMVTTGSFCSSDPAPADLSQVMTTGLQGDGGSPPPAQDPTVTIDPAAMPAGTELSFGTFQVATGQETAIALIDTGSYTCTSTAPATLPPRGALLLYGQPTGS